MESPTLTREQALRYLLHAQGLTQPFSTPLEALEAVIAVQTQYAASLPTALAARTKKVPLGWHSRDEQEQVIKSWSLRNTLHAHTRESHALLLDVLGGEMNRKYERWMLRVRGIEGDELARLQSCILAALREGPLTRVQLHERVPEFKGMEMVGWGLDVMGLAYKKKLKLIVTDSGPTQFALHHATLRPPCTPEALVQSYLEAYGPATMKDFAYWTGLKMADVRPAFEDLGDELQPVLVEGLKGTRFMTREGYAKISEMPRVPTLRLLAKFDPLTMGHADKSLFLKPEHRTRVFRKAGQVEAIVLWRGQAVGTYRIHRKGNVAEIDAELFAKTDKTFERLLAREAAKTAGSLGLGLGAISITHI